MAVSTSYPFIQLVSHNNILLAICAGGHVWELKESEWKHGDEDGWQRVPAKPIHWQHCDWKRVSE